MSAIVSSVVTASKFNVGQRGKRKSERWRKEKEEREWEEEGGRQGTGGKGRERKEDIAH